MSNTTDSGANTPARSISGPSRPRRAEQLRRRLTSRRVIHHQRRK